MKTQKLLLTFFTISCATISAQDSLKTQHLKQVEIEANKPKRYLDTLSNAGTRLPLKLLQTPQSIQVITNPIIQDQQAQSLNDVTKNMVGVINNNNFSSYTMRGFSSIGQGPSNNNFIAFDGILGNMYYWQQLMPLYNIDKVENIGGPASALYSVGTPGGVINMVTKKPLEQAAYSFNVVTGSWGLINVSADLGGPLSKNKKLLYRLNVGYNNQNSFRPLQYTDNLVIAPTIAYKFSEKTSINLEYVLANNNSKAFEDNGGALLMNKDSTFNWKGINKKTIFYSPDDYGHVKNNYSTLTFKHKFSENFKLTYVCRGTLSNLKSGQHTGSYYNGGGTSTDFLAYPDSMQRQYTIWNDQSYNFMNQLYTTETFGGEKFRQTFVTGVDYQVYGSKDYYVNGTANSISFSNPNYSQDAFSNYPLSSAYVQDNKQQTRQFGAYIQDLISIGSKLKVLLAGRYENFNWISRPNGQDNYTQTNDSSTAHVFLPRFGLVYSFNNNHSVYASYCQSYNPQYDNSRGSGGPFPPQLAKQYEIGYKAQYFGGRLMSTVALYNIDYVNVLQNDPTDTTHKRQIVIPGLTSNGAEFTLIGNMKQFSILGSYALNHIVFAANSPLGNKGQRFDNSPNNIANVWIKYSLPYKSKLKGLSLSIGGKYVGNRIGSATLAPNYVMPAYFLLDAAINYSFNKFTIGLNGYNLLNTTYVTGWYASDFMAQIGTPLNWKLSIRYTIK